MTNYNCASLAGWIGEWWQDPQTGKWHADCKQMGLGSRVEGEFDTPAEAEAAARATLGAATARMARELAQ
jgi:hypothetical protein